MRHAVLGLTLLAASAMLADRGMAADPSAADLAQGTIERRATEAVIWGMPAVNYDLMLQEMLDQDAGQGRTRSSTGAGRSTGTTRRSRPNPDTLYFMAFFNTKDVARS